MGEGHSRSRLRLYAPTSQDHHETAWTRKDISIMKQSQLELVHTLFPGIAFIQNPFKVQILLQMLDTIKGRQ
jgi:hypothetical protein